MEVTIYGPSDLFKEIGSWFEEYQVYLQDPQQCHLQVKYYNPHRLSSDDIMTCPLVSKVVAKGSRVLQLVAMPQQDDLLDMLSSRGDLKEAQQPSVIKRELKKSIFW